MKPGIVIVLGLLVCACGSASSPSPVSSRLVTAPTVVVRISPRPRPRPRPAVPRVPPGSLPQTHQLPSAATPVFHAEMAKLWAGVVSGSLPTAMAAFFPEPAYVRVKAVADPAGDYRDRLVGDYRLDLAAAHALVAPGARLLRVQVPSGYAHWVDPGVCYNRVGYYEVPNARVVYESAGATRSFGIASMISWRGVWYVVHLGAVTRAGAEGVVDDPSAGTGVSVASSTC